MRILFQAAYFSVSHFSTSYLKFNPNKSAEIFQDPEVQPYVSDILNTYTLAFISYSLILFIEKVAFDSHSLLVHEHHLHKNQIEDPHEELEIKLLENKDDEVHFQDEDSKVSCKSCIVRYSDDIVECAYKDEVAVKSVFNKIGKFETYMKAHNNKIKTDEEKEECGRSANIECNLNEFRNVFSPIKKARNSNLALHEHHVGKKTSMTTALVLLIALSIHGFLEGLAFGLQKTMSSAFGLGFGILAHKWAESLSLVSY